MLTFVLAAALATASTPNPACGDGCCKACAPGQTQTTTPRRTGPDDHNKGGAHAPMPHLLEAGS